MYAEDFGDKRREQLATGLARYMGPGSRTLAGQLATDGLIRALGEGHPQDAKLAEWVRRVRLALPDMDWWAVQNHLWDKGTEKWPLLSAELYFARRG